MRRVLGYAVALCLAGGAAAAQKAATAEDLDKVMKKAGAFRQVDKAIQANNAADARAQLKIVRQAVEDSQFFWVTHKKDDAVKLNKESLAKLDALDQALAGGAFDAAAATAAFKEAGAGCRACHTQYRGQDADNNYILKPGTVNLP